MLLGITFCKKDMLGKVRKVKFGSSSRKTTRLGAAKATPLDNEHAEGSSAL